MRIETSLEELNNLGLFDGNQTAIETLDNLSSSQIDELEDECDGEDLDYIVNLLEDQQKIQDLLDLDKNWNLLGSIGWARDVISEYCEEQDYYDYDDELDDFIRFSYIELDAIDAREKELISDFLEYVKSENIKYISNFIETNKIHLSVEDFAKQNNICVSEINFDKIYTALDDWRKLHENDKLCKEYQISDVVKMYNLNVILCDNIPQLDTKIHNHMEQGGFNHFYITDCKSTTYIDIQNRFQDSSIKLAFSEILGLYIMMICSNSTENYLENTYVLEKIVSE